MYDIRGLVTPEVASLPNSPSLNSPGHDKYAPPEFFLPHRPTYLLALYFSGSRGRANAEEQAASWRSQYAEHGYAPVIIDRTEPESGWVVVLKRGDRSGLDRVGRGAHPGAQST